MSDVLGTVCGRSVTEDDVQAAIDNAVAGFPKVTARQVGRPLMGERPARTVAVRLDPEIDKALLERLAKTGESASDVMREALRNYLHTAAYCDSLPF
ncbi:MAG: ribbon-helix-helix protein, CopG family, partial [Propionibacteriaceae bacterium]|nr:ribbon-helix-helix protein, CopG family [Propionibacteriaceae bacterium]